MSASTNLEFRIFDFNVYNGTTSSFENDSNDEDDENNNAKFKKDNTEFVVQMFGVNETGKTCSITVNDFKPFFYVKVDNRWNMAVKDLFLDDITKKGKFFKNSITDCKIIERKKLYGFDNGKLHKFIRLEFCSMNSFNKAKNLWYDKNRELLKNGYVFYNTKTELYEANIPPILRFFHIKEISPSGWISVPKRKVIAYTNPSVKKTTCEYEYQANYKDIIALNEKETPVPYKIMSFDIEASSSHGDFPVPVKSYKKLATNIVDFFDNHSDVENVHDLLFQIIFAAFGFGHMPGIDIVYPKAKETITEEYISHCFEKWIHMELKYDSSRKDSLANNAASIEQAFLSMHAENEENDIEGNGNNSDSETDEPQEKSSYSKKRTFHKMSKPSLQIKNVFSLLEDECLTREQKLLDLNLSLCDSFPPLEGDKVTFIGSTFMYYGKKEPHFNHCLCLNTCDAVENATIETCSTERELLLKWQQLVQRENPDIIIGYNIFGFDYDFMFRRSLENNCATDFLKLSRNKDEVCAQWDKERNQYKIEETSIQIASGQHDLRFIKITGRLQVDLYNFFRREENLTSYKLDYVAGHFIGDYVKDLKQSEIISSFLQSQNEDEFTEIKTGNMTGLLVGSFVHFEEIAYSVDYYDNGNKFLVTFVDKEKGIFRVNKWIRPDMKKKVRWCLAKDDVTPKDIFEMTNGSSADRAIIAKYCIQDCNLVNYLFNKADILTGFIEMAKICSVPINFLVMRGQGIKLTSYISKKCREKRTLMPVLDKGDISEAYEGAIVLDPKSDLYLDNPVACVDYASLYPSSMISENLSHDTKVWTKEYDLAGNLKEEWGEKNAEGEFIYDNLPGYEYVTVSYTTYSYVKNANNPLAKPKKVQTGRKVCRFVQPSNNSHPVETTGIMPSILKELLLARKTTRKLIPDEKDEFMKNVLDKRQLGYKVTANSLYGQCGAKTSTFYEKDIAACTTATGQLLLTYAKKIIELCYGDNVCETKNYGPVRTKAEYIYGDTDSVFFTFNLQDIDGNPIRGKKALEITIELAQQAGHLASSFLKGPHDLEYEKTFMPFCLLSKKRYVGMLYEIDPNKCKRKEMGIVLKRRDNAPIVKDVYGGIIDILMKSQNVQESIAYLKSCLQGLVDGNYPMEKLIITKSLRSDYKNPKSIAHKVLADRMAERDPGNKPGPGDRIPFVYVSIPGLKKDAKQGEKIETPQFILENKLKIDYSFYITNQIMKPVQQVYALVLLKMWESQNKLSKIMTFKKEVAGLKQKFKDEEDSEKFEKAVEKLKNKEVKALLFDEFLRETDNAKKGNQSLAKFGFFKPKT